MIEYTINKNKVATTEVDMPDNRVLQIVTMKRYGGALATTAAVYKKENGFLVATMFQDFAKIIATSTPSRVTVKAVETQHIGTVVEDILAEAIAFYQK